jgi:hypothetical protein
MAPLIAIVVIVVVLIAAIGAYVVGGYAYATSKLNSAQAAYNKVVDHQNDLNDTVNALGDKLTGAGLTSSSSSQLESDKTLITQIVTKSQSAQGQINQDDSSLADAQSGLTQNQWLTVIRKPDIDKSSARLGHARKALSIAKEITADYVKIGTFYEAFFDVAIDAETLGTKAQASDLTGASAADEKLKTDVAKAISLDKAPGLPPEFDSFLKDVQTFANDFASVVNAKTSAQANAADAALQADVKKLQAADFSKISSEIDSYYKPLIDSYNSEVDKANAT